jgi:hypothetical protein
MFRLIFEHFNPTFQVKLQALPGNPPENRPFLPHSSGKSTGAAWDSA